MFSLKRFDLVLAFGSVSGIFRTNDRIRVEAQEFFTESCSGWGLLGYPPKTEQ